MWGEGLGMLDMARLGIGLNRQDGRVNGMIPGGDKLVIDPLDEKFIYAIPLAELDAKPKAAASQ